MRLLDIFRNNKIFKNKVSTGIKKKTSNIFKTSNSSCNIEFADSSSISADEKEFYQPDSYYTLESYPGTLMAQKVITFEERKKTTFPSTNGLYVAEILLLDYCKNGYYPKPKNGYPGFWWFKYGIRDIGHILESLEKRGFIKWGEKKELLSALKLPELQEIAIANNISKNQTKDNLIKEIKEKVSEENLPEQFFSKKYVLTELGERELLENGYVPYMHKNKFTTIEGLPENKSFNVWDINKLFHNNPSSWKELVGNIEKERFGVSVANKENIQPKEDSVLTPKEILEYLNLKMPEILKASKKSGDGFEEEMKGLNLKKIGEDKEALYYFYISINKKFDAPALYSETAKLLRKYKLYEEELKVLDYGIKNVPICNSHREELIKRKNNLKKKINKL